MRGCFYLFCFMSILLCLQAQGQPIKGQVIDMTEKKPIPDVSITDVRNTLSTASNGEGNFTLYASKGQLIELKKPGYKTLRVRIPEGTIPPFFKLGLERQKSDAVQGNVPPKDYHEDSIKYATLYKHELEFPKMSGLDMIQHPFSAMSKHNREIWAFQDNYSWFQQEKYINYTFNDKLVNSITGLTGDSLQIYMHTFRPSYDRLRNMNEYSFYTYIRETAVIFRQKGIHYRTSPSRSSR
jgi:hypothetical protein